MPANARASERDTPQSLRRENWTITALALAAAALVCIPAWLFLSHATALFLTAIALGTVHGISQGLARTVAGLAAAIAAILFAPPLGRALEGTLGPLFNLGGLAARGASIALCGLVLLLGLSLALRSVAKRAFKNNRLARYTDRILGAGAGLVQGLLLAVLLLWVPLSLEPVLNANQAAPPPATDEQPEQPAPPPVRLIERWADEVRKSSLAPIAAATNPLPDTRWLSLLRDFAMISRNREAMEALMNSDVMKKIADLPSVRTAIEQLRADPSLAPLLESEGVSEHDVLQVLNSPTVLKILEDSRILQEFEPLAPELEKAIAQAKSKMSK